MIVDNPPKAEEALSVDVGNIGRVDLRTGALKSTNPANAAPKLPAHPVAVLPVGARDEVKVFTFRVAEDLETFQEGFVTVDEDPKRPNAK
jgi:hypothetical protein